MKKSLSIVLFMLTLSAFAQLKVNNTVSYYSMKATFNLDNQEIVDKIKNLGDKILATKNINNMNT